MRGVHRRHDNNTHYIEGITRAVSHSHTGVTVSAMMLFSDSFTLDKITRSLACHTDVAVSADVCCTLMSLCGCLLHTDVAMWMFVAH